MTNPLRNIVRRIVLWACPGLRADTTGMRADIDIAHRAIALARRDTAVAVASMAEWQTYVKGLAKVVMAQDREIAALKAERVPAALDQRLARLEMLFMQPISDAGVEEQAQAALEDALRGMSEGSA